MHLSVQDFTKITNENTYACLPGRLVTVTLHSIGRLASTSLVPMPGYVLCHVYHVPELPDHPDADHDAWSQAYCIGDHQLIILMFEPSL